MVITYLVNHGNLKSRKARHDPHSEVLVYCQFTHNPGLYTVELFSLNDHNEIYQSQGESNQSVADTRGKVIVSSRLIWEY